VLIVVVLWFFVAVPIGLAFLVSVCRWGVALLVKHSSKSKSSSFPNFFYLFFITLGKMKNAYQGTSTSAGSPHS